MVLPAGTAFSSPSSFSRSNSGATSRHRGGGGGVGQRPVVTAISRPPILMEFTDDFSYLHFGLVGDAKPKHVLPFTSSSCNSSSNNNNNLMMMMLFGQDAMSSDVVVRMRQTNVSVGTWYRTLAPLLQKVYHALGPDGKERRVVVVLPPHVAIPSSSSSCDSNNLIVPINFKAALLQCLLQNNNNNNSNSNSNAMAGSGGTSRSHANNISVSLQCSMSLVPYALPMISTAMLLVNVGMRDVSCMIHAAGHSLPFTFQTIPIMNCGSSDYDWTTTTTATSSIVMDEIILALLQCLQACPRAARKHAIHNVVFCGPGIVHQPELSLRVVQRLQQVLRRQQSLTTSSSMLHEEEPPTDAAEEEPQHDDDEPKSMIHRHGFGIVPVNLKELQPLAEHAGLADYVVFPQQQQQQQDEQRRRPRPDLLAWTGASLWAWHWHNRAENDAQFHWIGK
jgi:hypothetical protein